MKTMSQLVAGGGWRGTRVDRIKVKAWLALLLAMACGAVSILSIGSVLFYACIPAVAGLTIAVVLFFRERPIEIESLSGRVGADPRKLYGSFGGCDRTTHKRSAERLQAASLCKSIEDPFGHPVVMDDDEAIALADARDRDLESGRVAALSHENLMRRLRQWD